ncbi:prolyl oligopeptidase family protein [Nonomuraea sp. NPDC050663]|uniref:prolyl oligopeptidase family protein n=1 Tax=Nonomuraea sp. NPDC050663 TaxID=3364370 RepID=UPI0037B432DD
MNDPFRWLEDPSSRETRDWHLRQDELWNRHLSKLAWREEAMAQIRAMSAAGEVSAPTWRGEHQFITRRAAWQDHAVLYRDDKALIDPNLLDSSGATVLDDWQPDLEGRQVAFQLSRGGDERSALYVVDADTGQIVDGPVPDCRYSPVAWLPDGKAFYYVRQGAVWLRRVGGPEERLCKGQGIGLSHDGRWLVVAQDRDVRIIDLPESTTRAVQEGVQARTVAAVGPDGRLYVATDRDAPLGRLCVADPGRPDEWRELVPQDPEAVFAGFAVLETRLLVAWLRDAVSEVTVHDLDSGARIGEVPLPGPGSVGPISVRGDEAWFVYTDYVTPSTVLRYPGEAPVMEAEIRSERVEAISADGTRVPVLVLSRPGDSGPRPTILYGYGGFGIPLTPAYSTYILPWVLSGGVFALAGVRGGGERGEEWHRQGMRADKQNSFDDFVASASLLIEGGWTTPSQLGACGESNGGLLVGAAITQRPELFGAAVMSAAVLDMARYELFGMGASWRQEYGSADVPEELEWLMAYSPYHHVRPGVRYPATLFTVFEGDTRVDPMHARKMYAAMMESGVEHVYLRRERHVGHGRRAYSRGVELAADLLAFFRHHLR